MTSTNSDHPVAKNDSFQSRQQGSAAPQLDLSASLGNSSSPWASKKSQSGSTIFNEPADRGRASASMGVRSSDLGKRSGVRRTKLTVGGYVQATDLDEILWDDSPGRVRVARIICSKRCKLFMTMAIFFSMGLAVHETNLGAANEESEQWFDMSMSSLTGLYSLEILARLYVSGPAFFTQILNLFDFFLVVTDIAMFFLESITGETPNLFALRLVRLVRTLRIIRILTFVRPLYLILHGFISAMQSIFWATTLLILTIMLWSTLAVNFLHPINVNLVENGLHEDCFRCQRAFSTVSDACLFFAESTIAGETFGDVSIPIIHERPSSLFLFLGVHITIQLGIMNLILAVIVDQAAAARVQDAEQMLVDKEEQMLKAKEGLYRLCIQMDRDYSGSLTLEELLHGVDTLPDFMNQMRLMDISRDDMAVVFGILDVDKSGDVNYREFVEELYKMKAGDSHTLLIFIKHYVLELREALSQQVSILKDYVENDMQCIHQDLSNIFTFITGITEDEETPDNSKPPIIPRLTYRADRSTGNAGRFSSSSSVRSSTELGVQSAGFSSVADDCYARDSSVILEKEISFSLSSPRADLRQQDSGTLRRPVAEGRPVSPISKLQPVSELETKADRLSRQRAEAHMSRRGSFDSATERSSERPKSTCVDAESTVRESAIATHKMRNSREGVIESKKPDAVGDVDDEESKVWRRGLSDGGEPEAGSNEPTNMSLYDDPCDMALWDATREDAARADRPTHL